MNGEPGAIRAAIRSAWAWSRWILVPLLGIAAIAYAACRWSAPPNGLAAKYFAGTHWGDAATAASYVDNVPSTTALHERWPDFEHSQFSVEWNGFLAVFRGGTYTFRTVSDDGSWVFVRGQQVVDNGGAHAARAADGGIALQPGIEPLSIRYFQDGGQSVFELWWSRDGGPFELVPPSALLRERVSLARVATFEVSRVLLAAALVACYLTVVGALGFVAVRVANGWDSRLPDRNWTLRWALPLTLVVYAVGIWWGMPNRRGWGPDEVVPADVLGALQAGFSHGWSSKYPPFHYALLAAADAPVLIASRLRLLDAWATGPYVTLVLIGRAVSLAFSAGLLAVVYRCGLELYGRRGAIAAALITAVTLPLGYYAKLANLDVPYLFWFSLSLLAYIRILKHHERRDYVLFAVSAALAGCTKDQIWGAYILMPFAILVARWQARPPGTPLIRVVFDGTTVRAIAAGIATLLVANNIVFNLSGFKDHVAFLLATPSQFQEFPPTVAGQFHLALAVMQEMRYMFGWPLAIIVAVGSVRAILGRTTTPSLRWLLVPAVSYYVVFLGLARFYFDRYLFPVTIVLALFAGSWLDGFLARGVRARALRLVCVVAAFAYGLLSVIDVDYVMVRDSRYGATRWLHAHVQPDEVVGALGPLEFALVADGFRESSVESLEDVAQIEPAFIVLNADQMPTLPPAVRDMHAALLDGRAGYRLALTSHSDPLPLPGQHPDLAAPRHGPEFSDLAMINPTIEIFERKAAR